MKNKIAVHKKRREHVQKNVQQKLSSEIMYNQAKEVQKKVAKKAENGQEEAQHIYIFTYLYIA